MGSGMCIGDSACTEVHSPVDLPRISGQDFGPCRLDPRVAICRTGIDPDRSQLVQRVRESYRVAGFSGSGGSEDGDEFWKLGHGEWGCDDYIIRYSEVLSIP